MRVSKSSQRDLVRAFLLRHNLRNKRPVPLAVAPGRGSGTVVRHSHCTLLRHIKTAQQRVDLPHRAATTKASMYSRALRKLRRVRHRIVRTVGRAFGGVWQHTLIPLSLCGGSSTAGTLRGVRLDCECATGLGKHHTIRGCCVWTRLTLAL